MDVSTREQWSTIAQQTVSAQPRVAEILKPYVCHNVHCIVAHHQHFQGRYDYEFLGMNPNLRDQHADEPWYELTETFADHWDQTSFDSEFTSSPLEHFAPMVRREFARAKSL